MVDEFIAELDAPILEYLKSQEEVGWPVGTLETKSQWEMHLEMQQADKRRNHQIAKTIQ